MAVIGAMVDWWRQFDDPVLGRLIVQAEADGPSLDEAWTKIEKARATLTTTRADGLPSLSGSGSLSREGSRRPKAARRCLPPAAAPTSMPPGNWICSARCAAMRRRRRARIDARVDDWHDARVSLAAEVADTYVQYRACGLLARPMSVNWPR